jgi:DNA-binding protein HU-beta
METARVLNIPDRVIAGDDVHIPGFRIFTTVHKAGRTGVNPRTLEKIEIPSMIVPKFSPAKRFKDAVKTGGAAVVQTPTEEEPAQTAVDEPAAAPSSGKKKKG